MPGVIAIIVALLIFPVIAIMGSVTIAGLLGFLLNRDSETRNAGSELIDTNYWTLRRSPPRPPDAHPPEGFLNPMVSCPEVGTKPSGAARRHRVWGNGEKAV